MSGLDQVAVLGSSGFVGSAVLRSLTERPGTKVVGVSAPRLRTDGRSARRLRREAERAVAGSGAAAGLVDVFRGVDVVINAAGDSAAAGADDDGLIGANGLLPFIALLAAELAGVSRFVQISSAAVQGAAEVLDESPRRDPFSPYSLSKCLGEELVLSHRGPIRTVVYRPTSVHGADRPMTRRVAAIARSPLCSVAGAGDRPTPQVLVDNVAAAAVHLAFAPEPPSIVLHPWEGITTAGLMKIFSAGRRPRAIPSGPARLAMRAAQLTIGRLGGRAADIRRIELMWFGQRQAEGWLTDQGWKPPVGPDGWRRLAREIRPHQAVNRSGALASEVTGDERVDRGVSVPTHRSSGE